MLGVSGCSNVDAHCPADLLVTHWVEHGVGVPPGRGRRDQPRPKGTMAAKGTENLQGWVRSHDNRRLYVANWGSGKVTTYRLAAKESSTTRSRSASIASCPG